MNASESKVMVFEREEAEVFDLITSCRVRMPTGRGYEIALRYERMQEVKEFKT